MESFLKVSLLISLVITACILTAGLLIMGRGGQLNARWGNRLMQWRIIAQGIALGLFALLLYYKSMH